MPRMDAESVRELKKRVKYPSAPKVGLLPVDEDLYTMALSACVWPGSKRNTWIEACVQLAQQCKRDEDEGEDEQDVPVAKRCVVDVEVVNPPTATKTNLVPIF